MPIYHIISLLSHWSRVQNRLAIKLFNVFDDVIRRAYSIAKS